MDSGRSLHGAAPHDHVVENGRPTYPHAPFRLATYPSYLWEGNVVDVKDMGINAEAENQVFVDWGSGSVPIPRASRGRIGCAGAFPFWRQLV